MHGIVTGLLTLYRVLGKFHVSLRCGSESLSKQKPRTGQVAILAEDVNGLEN